MEYDVIIGLEIHAELKTKSKMFCACDNNAQGREPNTVVCPICLGHPGTLPYPNKQAIEWTVLIGSALNCRINETSKFDRKNYFYPDLTKGYQISQYDLPIAYAGSLEVDGDNIAVTRIHLEEDTGKNIHPQGKNYSLVDLNRAGTPLIEMVTEPVIKSAAQAKKFCQLYQQILRYLEISNADMEKGEMRCEANISVQETGNWEYEADYSSSGKGGAIKAKNGYQLNPKIEVKNINSFRALEKAIEYEINRQVCALKDGEKLVQETRGWNDNEEKTFSQRVKETAADYRYFPDPDIPPIKFDGQWIESIKSRLIELPLEKKNRFIEQYNLPADTAEMIVADKALAEYFENIISELESWMTAEKQDWEKYKAKLTKATANWILAELFKHFKNNSETIEHIKITPENFAEMILLVHSEKISSSAGQTILSVMYEKGGEPKKIMAELNLEQMDNSDELEQIIKEVLTKNEKQVEEYKSGKEAVLQYLVGQVMAASRGKANPAKAGDIIKKICLD